MCNFYNSQVKDYQEVKKIDKDKKVEDFINTDESKIKWTRALRKSAMNNMKYIHTDSKLQTSVYRPFTKQNLYFDKAFIESPGLNAMIFPNQNIENLAICISASNNDGLAVLMSKYIADYHFNGDSHIFPLYYYEEKKEKGLFDTANTLERKDGISDFMLQRAKGQYNASNITKEDIFYYVYGFLHIPKYRETFADDLKKSLPRLPLVDKVDDFWKISKIGKELSVLHVDYENVPLCEDVEIQGEDSEFYRVEKMRFPKKGQKDTIIFNSKITISNIPEKAYKYTVNGKSAIEWIMERYQITTHKDSGIKNDPNDWCDEHNDPKYIFELLLRVINVSVTSVDLVEQLPDVGF